MLAFHVTIHAGTVSPQEEASQVPRGGGMAEPFAVSFEQASETLARLPRLFIEPDGSFVWTSPAGEEPWQLDGMLYDRQERLLYVELKGRCPGSKLDELLAALGWPDTRVVFQLVREGRLLDEAAFRATAEQAPP